MWRMGDAVPATAAWQEIRFLTRIDGGKIVLSNGRALMKPVPRTDPSKL